MDKFHVTWNYIYTGTPIALKKKVNEKNFGSGLSTRLTVIPMPKTNYEMIEFQEKTAIDWQRLERMKTWAYKLDARAGELPFWPLVKRLYDWTKNRMADCAEDDSEANELMLKRVPYHALNYAAPFIDMRHFDSMHLEGKFWEGEYEVDDTDWKKRHYSKSVEGFNKLPEIFQMEDVMKSFGYNSESSAYSKIRRLTIDQMIEKTEEAGLVKYRKINHTVV